MTVSICHFDVFFISYDEPNADENWSNLLEKCPWAKRSHGVYGSDAAHKACAKQANSARFISVDADNVVDPAFFDVGLDEDVAKSSQVVSWAGRNKLNGLVYGNGGLKCWPTDFVLQMKTHEIAESPRAQVEFCWDKNYVQMREAYSEVCVTASPYQAWRAGFREGVKMSLERGVRVKPSEFGKRIWYDNQRKLSIWCSIGSDIENGIWAIYGARLGCYLTCLTDWDFINVRDFKFLTEMWEKEIASKFEDGNHICPRTGYCWNEQKLVAESARLKIEIINGLGLPIADMDKEGSRFFRSIYIAPPRIKKRK